jgi:hypothetical protein
MESAIQIACFAATVVALVLSIVAIWLSLYFYRRSNEVYNSLSGVVSRIEASTKVTEVASKDMILPIVQTVQEVFRSSARGHIDSLRPAIIQRSAAGIDEALKELSEPERTKIREAVYAEIDSFLGTLKYQMSSEFSPIGNLDTIRSSVTIPTTSKPIPGSISYDWVPFIRRIRDLQAGNRFLSVKHLRETVFKNEPDSQEALQVAIDKEMLSTYYHDNPKNPQFPTLACKLNSEHPVIREIIQAIGSRS